MDKSPQFNHSKGAHYAVIEGGGRELERAAWTKSSLYRFKFQTPGVHFAVCLSLHICLFSGYRLTLNTCTNTLITALSLTIIFFLCHFLLYLYSLCANFIVIAHGCRHPSGSPIIKSYQLFSHVLP